MTIQDCIEHYDLVLVCTRQIIIKFVDDINRPEVVSNRALLGDVRYGLKDTIIIKVCCSKGLLFLMFCGIIIKGYII